jgi:hypothetical protein
MNWAHIRRLCECFEACSTRGYGRMTCYLKASNRISEHCLRIDRVFVLYIQDFKWGCCLSRTTHGCKHAWTHKVQRKCHLTQQCTPGARPRRFEGECIPLRTTGTLPQDSSFASDQQSLGAAVAHDSFTSTFILEFNTEFAPRIPSAHVPTQRHLPPSMSYDARMSVDVRFTATIWNSHVRRATGTRTAEARVCPRAHGPQPGRNSPREHMLSFHERHTTCTSF